MSTKPTDESVEDVLRKEAQSAWDALTQFRESWDDKERALLAQTSDSFSGNVTRARVTDAALSTLAFERQARVAAQLPTGKIHAASKADEGKAKLLNIVLQRYILPNANSQFDMLIKQRMWGVYASVYGSMPMLYDYRVDDQYIGPDCWLIDPRCFLPQPGFNSIQDMDWCMVSTIKSLKELESLSQRKNTTWDKKALKKLLKEAKDGKPSRDDDSNKDSVTSTSRYTKEQAKGRVELITKYESGDGGHWITFAPDYKGLILRNIPNPHKSGKIPIVMRHCFPLLNSIYGLGDFERGMKIQKAKDSFLGLRLEYAKNKVFPSLKINPSNVTMSTIKNQANGRWLVKDMRNSAEPVTYGNDSENAFQNTYQTLDGILMNQFGTSDTRVNGESGMGGFGKTPQALKMLESRENARDTWDRFMHEKASEELYEGMTNLLSVKMEKPIDFNLFEEDIRALGQDHPNMEVFSDGKSGKITLAKKDVKNEKGYRYLIDANSSMRQDDEAQLQALMQLLNIRMSAPDLEAMLNQNGKTWDLAEHIKKVFLSSGIQDPEQILKDMEQRGAQGVVDPQQQAMQEQQMQEQAMQEQMMAEQQAQQQQLMEQASQFQDPDVMAAAQQLLGGN